MSAPLKSDTVSVLSGDPRLDHLVRGIGHVLLMKVDPEAAKALNISRFVLGRGTHANDDGRPAAPRAAGSVRNGG